MLLITLKPNSKTNLNYYEIKIDLHLIIFFVLFICTGKDKYGYFAEQDFGNKESVRA
jgi:hypothetical protein